MVRNRLRGVGYQQVGITVEIRRQHHLVHGVVGVTYCKITAPGVEGVAKLRFARKHFQPRAVGSEADSAPLGVVRQAGAVFAARIADIAAAVAEFFLESLG